MPVSSRSPFHQEVIRFRYTCFLFARFGYNSSIAKSVISLFFEKHRRIHFGSPHYIWWTKMNQGRFYIRFKNKSYCSYKWTCMS